MASPVKLGLVGCGAVTHAKHLPALSGCPEASVVALCDIEEKAVQAVGNKFGIPQRFTDVADMLSRADIEAVGVCTPPGTHADVASVAFRAGKHVLIEKPLALTVDDCRRIIDEARRARTTAMAGFHMRFHRLIRQARDIILRGELGTVESIRVVWHSPKDNGNLPEWKVRRSTGGGALVEIAVHHFDLVRYLLGSEFNQVFAISRSGNYDDECAVVSARLADSTLVAGEFSERSAHEIGIIISGHERVLRIDCQRFDGLDLRERWQPAGSPSLRLAAAANFVRTLPVGLTTMRSGGDYLLSYRAAWSHFCAAIQLGTPVESTLEDGLRAVAIVSAAVESSLKGCPVPVQ